MFFSKKPIDTATQIVKQYGPNLEQTQNLLKQQISSLQDFATTDIPQMKTTQAELVASLEKLSQSAKSLIKK